MNEILRFLVVGAFNTLLFYGLYCVFIWLGMNYNIALMLEYLGGILCGYWLNRTFTFRARGQKQVELVKYIIVYAAVFLANLLLLNFIVRSGLLGPELGQGLALCVVTGLSYLLQNRWVFRSAPAADRN